MKILHLNCVWERGSTGALLAALHRAIIAEGHESVVCFGRGKAVSEKGVYKVCPEAFAKLNKLWSFFSGQPYGGCLWGTAAVIRRIKREKPDAVHLHCINGYFVNISRLVSWLKKSGIKTVLTLHAEFMYTGGCSHAFECEGWKNGCKGCPNPRRATKSVFLNRCGENFDKMRRAFSGFGENLLVVSVSPWLAGRAKSAPILCEAKHITIPNGVDDGVFFPCESGEIAGKTVFHPTAYFSGSPGHPKGGAFVISLARKMPQTRFIVAGKHDKNIKVPENIHLLGEISSPEKMAEYYRRADAVLLCSRRETFSMPVAESLCCGTPIAAFYAGGPESIAPEKWCAFAPYGDAEALEKALRAQMELKPRFEREIAEDARARYCVKAMTAAYMQAYGGLCHE